jgi:hypothetical protein
MPVALGLINYRDTKVKLRHLKKIDRKRDLTGGVYQSLQTGSGDTVSHVDIFDPALSVVAPLTFSLV